MKRWGRVAAAVAGYAILSGCPAARPAAKEKHPPGLSVRLHVAVAAAATLDIASEPSLGHPELPLSAADESRGRWLTFFEMDYSPAKPPLPLPPVIEEEPSR